MPRSCTAAMGLYDEKGRQEIGPRGPSSMLPLNSIIKDAFDKFDYDFQAANLPEGKYIKAPSTSKWYKVGQPCYEDKIQELNTDLLRSVLLLSPLGPLWARFPYQLLRNWNTKRGKTSPRSTLLLPLPRLLLAMPLKCQYSWKSTFKKVKSQIRKGADPEKAAKRGYEEACEYLDIWNKTVLIQHRALTCLSKSLAHILQRELYSMGNTGLLRCEAEMTLLQPHLGETTHQELRNSSFWPPSLFKSQLVKEDEDFLL